LDLVTGLPGFMAKIIGRADTRGGMWNIEYRSSIFDFRKEGNIEQGTRNKKQETRNKKQAFGPEGATSA
jgi:hypothetical protein